MDTSPDDHSKCTVLGLGDECDIPDLAVTGIRKRSDGVFIIYSNAQIAMSLSLRQMKIVVAAANAEHGHLNRRELHAVVFPDQARRQLRHPVLTANGPVTFFTVPLSPSQRASMCRTVHRLTAYGLIESCAGQTAGPTESGKSIAKWVSDRPELLDEG
jgi:hypothetical protein